MSRRYSPPPSARMSVNFREADLRVVMGHVHAGKSVEIIGVGSSGKSNFLRRLLMQEVQERYLYEMYGEDAHCVFINLDANSLLEPIPSAMNPAIPSGWPGYELIASRLLRIVMETGLASHVDDIDDPTHPENLFSLYHRIWPGENTNTYAHIVAFRYLEDLVNRVFVGANRRIRLIFIFDEFEKMLDEMPPRFFQSLRSLRDQFKDRLIYITAARQIMPLLVSQNNYQQYEPFIELFTDTRHFLLPYQMADTEQTFGRLARRQDYPMPPEPLRRQLLKVTNGHAGLLRAAFSAWAPENLIQDGLPDNRLVEILHTVPAIQDECKTIWRSLSRPEQRLLYDMVMAHHHRQENTVDAWQNGAARLLIRKGLLANTRHLSFKHVYPVVLSMFLTTAIRPGEQETPPDFPQTPSYD